MHLTGSVVSLDSLLFVDLPRIDAAAHTFEKRDLKAVAPTQSDPDSLKKNLQSGEWVLRSYAPKIPMVTYYKKQWVFSPQALEIAPKGLIERAEKRFSLTTIAAIDQADNAVAEKQRAIQTDKEKMIHDLRQMFVFVQIKKQDEIRRDRPTGIYHRDPMAPHSAPFGPPNDYIVDKVLTNIANESMINSYTFPGEAMWHSACTEHYFLESSFPWYDFKYCFNVQYEFSQWITNYHYKHTSAAYWAIRNAPEPEPEKPSEYALNGSPKIDRWVQVRLIDEDGKALPNKDYKIYPKHNRKSALFSGTTDKDGLSERITLGHAFERVQVVFPEDQDANIAESDSIDWTERVIDVPVIRPAPIINTKTFPDLNLRNKLENYQQDVMVLSLEEAFSVNEWAKQHWPDSYDKEAYQLSANLMKDYSVHTKDAYNVAVLARAFNGVGLQSYPKVVDGKTYLIFKGYAGIRRILTGTRYLADNAKIIQIGLGQKGLNNALKSGAVLSVFVISAIRTADYLIRDEVTMTEWMGGMGLDFAKLGVSTALAWGLGTASSGVAYIGAFALGPLIVVVTVGVLATFTLNQLDDHYRIEEKVIEFLEKSQQEVVEIAEKISDELEESFWDMAGAAVDGMLETGKEVIEREIKQYIREGLDSLPFHRIW